MRVWLLHLALLAALLAAGLLLPAYHATNLARILVLATFAAGYNLAFGYTGLLSLGHAMFFAAGMDAAGLPAGHWGWPAAGAYKSAKEPTFALSLSYTRCCNSNSRAATFAGSFLSSSERGAVLSSSACSAAK